MSEDETGTQGAQEYLVRATDGKVYGPFPLPHLQMMITRGKLGREQRVSTGDDNWHPAASLPGLDFSAAPKVEESPIWDRTEEAHVEPLGHRALRQVIAISCALVGGVVGLVVGLFVFTWMIDFQSLVGGSASFLVFATAVWALIGGGLGWLAYRQIIPE